MRGEGQYAELLRRRFDVACRRLGLNADKREAVETGKFRGPEAQGSLF
jgi:hypothetical protein